MTKLARLKITLYIISFFTNLFSQRNHFNSMTFHTSTINFIIISYLKKSYHLIINDLCHKLHAPLAVDHNIVSGLIKSNSYY